MKEFGTPMNTFAKIRAKASRHAANNPLALFRTVVSEEEVMNSKVMWPGVMTKLMACPPTCGAAAAIVCSDSFARQHGLRTAVRIRAQAMTTDTSVTFKAQDMREVVGSNMAKACAEKVYEEAGIGPKDVQVVELHDCFAHNELLTYEALGLCGRGGAQRFIEDGDNTYGGQIVTNPSGGLLSKGHPLGATGLAQCTELVQQLRGQADKRQVEGARIGLRNHHVRKVSRMIDKKFIGYQLKPSTLYLDHTRLQFFAKAIGEVDPVYLDTAAAVSAGYADLPAPPTFLFAAELDSGANDQLLNDLDIPLSKLLHGEQSFRYLKHACAGDTVTVNSTISDIYDKKNGQLEFVVKESKVTNQKNELIAEMRSVLVVRH